MSASRRSFMALLLGGVSSLAAKPQDVMTWTPSTLTMHWTRDGIPIPGATGNTYNLTAEDVGKTIARVGLRLSPLRNKT